MSASMAPLPHACSSRAEPSAASRVEGCMQGRFWIRLALAVTVALVSSLGWTASAQEGPSDRRPVLVQWGSSWWPARVVRTVGEHAWAITYEGYGAEWNEVVGPDRIRRLRPVSSRALEPGSPVLIEYGRIWYPGTVRSVAADGRVWVGYDGYGDEWDEAVTLDRLAR